MRILVLCCLTAIALGVAGLHHAGAAPDRDGEEPKLNRLATERSAYLRQHATNPVDWYPWCPEAFAAAAAQNRLVVLSIGYAACHWCHVMEKESFENKKLAKFLNERVICIKVDREERPDLDRVYMTALHALGARGGWPMTVILTPDRLPVWGGTYLKPERLEEIVTLHVDEWRKEPSRLHAKGQWTAAKVQELSVGQTLRPSRLSDRDLVANARLALQRRFDRANGGFLAPTKFPPHAPLLFYLDDGMELRPTELAQVAFTFARMAQGGIHDHVGGGFHRYSVDAEWFRPHFEKMLYDNALLARTYARMYALTDDDRYRRVAFRALAWIEHDLKQPNGGYGSSLDADTEGEEGLTYTWTADEIQTTLNTSDAGFIGNLMGVRLPGNFHDELTGALSGRNIIYLPSPVSSFARSNGTSEELVWMRMDRVLEHLLLDRLERAQPPRDDKVITAWNGLLVSALADAGVAFENPTMIQRAKDLANVLLSQSRRPNGTLLRFPAGSGPEIMGFCQDYVHLIEGLLTLADATDEAIWLRYAEELAVRLLRGFEDTENGGFWSTSHRGHERLIARSKPYVDGPIPSDNATAARVLLLLWAATANPDFKDAADRTLATFRPMLANEETAVHCTAFVGALRLRSMLERAMSPRAPGDDSVQPARIRQDVAAVDVSTDGGLAHAGNTATVRVRVMLDSGWHANPDDVEDGLVPTALRVTETSGLRLRSVRYPSPTFRRFQLAVEAVPVFEGTFEIVAEVERIDGTSSAKPALVLTLQTCDSSGACKAPIEITLPLR